MRISGLQKMTLLDYPGKVACTVFLNGCNFRCPFCHNSGLLDGREEELMTAGELIAFLEKRKGLLDGVCVSGGEPTLAPELPELLGKIKALGYSVKLDTNGSRPEILRGLIREGLVDYVAMDVKNSPARYGETVGIPGYDLRGVEKSMRILLSGETDYEFRTTVVAEFHDEVSVREMGQWLLSLSPEHKARRFFLQSFVDRESVLLDGLHAPTDGQMELFRDALAPYVGSVQIRGSM